MFSYQLVKSMKFTYPTVPFCISMHLIIWLIMLEIYIVIIFESEVTM